MPLQLATILYFVNTYLTQILEFAAYKSTITVFSHVYKNIPATVKAFSTSALEEGKLLRLEYLSPACATARIGFPRGFVESLGLHRQRLALVHQVIQFLPPFQHCLNCTVLKKKFVKKNFNKGKY